MICIMKGKGWKIGFLQKCFPDPFSHCSSTVLMNQESRDESNLRLNNCSFASKIKYQKIQGKLESLRGKEEQTQEEVHYTDCECMKLTSLNFTF